MNLFDLHSDTPTALFNGLKPATSFPPAIQKQVQTFAFFIKDDIKKPYEYYKSILRKLKSNLGYPINDFSRDKSVLLAVEGGALIEDKKDRIEELFLDGIRLLSLVWNGETVLAGGVNSEKGLTSLGREIISEMNKFRMVLDLSHLNDKSFYKAVELGEFTVATHSNSRVCHNHKRNLKDEQLKLIKEKNGLVGINFYPTFLGEGNTFENIYRHISYMLDLGLIDNISIGSDFDGADMSEQLDLTEKIPLLYEFLEKKGFNLSILDKIFYQNAMNFFKNAFDITV